MYRYSQYYITQDIKKYLKIPRYKLLDWIDVNELNWIYLSINPNAIELLKDNLGKINWHYLSLNPAAIDLLKENPNKIVWYNLSQNPAVIDLLKENPNKIVWSCFVYQKIRLQ